MPMIAGARRFSTDPFIDAANQNTAAWQQRRMANNMLPNAGMGAMPGGPSYGMGGGYAQPKKRKFGGAPIPMGGGMPMMQQPMQQPMQQQNPAMQMISSVQAAQNAANEANNNRFNEIMKGYLKRHDEGMKLADVRSGQAYKHMAANASQDMVNRGLFNSNEAAKKRFQAFETSQQIPLDQFNRTSGDPLLFAERRNDTGPDIGQMLQLAQVAGQSQSGIAGQSSPLSQGVNVGQYPAAAGLQAVQQRSGGGQPQVYAMPQFTGVMNPFGVGQQQGGGSAPYGLSRRQILNRQRMKASGGYDGMRESKKKGELNQEGLVNQLLIEGYNQNEIENMQPQQRRDIFSQIRESRRPSPTVIQPPFQTQASQSQPIQPAQPAQPIQEPFINVIDGSQTNNYQNDKRYQNEVNKWKSFLLQRGVSKEQVDGMTDYEMRQIFENNWRAF